MVLYDQYDLSCKKHEQKNCSKHNKIQTSWVLKLLGDFYCALKILCCTCYELSTAIRQNLSTYNQGKNDVLCLNIHFTKPFILSVCLHICLYTGFLPGTCGSQRKGFNATRVIDFCELQCGHWESNPGLTFHSKGEELGIVCSGLV